MSSLIRKSSDSSNLNNKYSKNTDKLSLDVKLSQKKNSLKKKSNSSNDIKLIKQEKIHKFNNKTSNTFKNNSKNKNNNIQNPNHKFKNKTNNIIPSKKESNEIINSHKILNKNKKQIKNLRSIESYPSIISTDTLTIKNNNIKISKKNEAEYIFSFNNINKQFKKESSSNSTIKDETHNLLQNNENDDNNKNKTIISGKHLSDITTTADKSKNFKNFWKSEHNEIKKREDKMKYNKNKKDIDKIKLDFKFENNSIIKEIDTSRNNSAQKDKKSVIRVEPDFIREIKYKNNIPIKHSMPINKNISYTLSLNYSSNTLKICQNKNNLNKFYFGENEIKNNIINYQTYIRNTENSNYYILSPINSTFKQINSKKSIYLAKILGNQRQKEDINEDDIDTVKQENTFGASKKESMTSETYKDIQIPKNCKYFFEVPEEQNYNHIQGPIEFEYDNSSGRETINNKNDISKEINCSKLNNINMYKLEKKDIGIDDDNINYFDMMKENDDTESNLNNKINNKFNSISTINEKTISNNCSFNNLNLNIKINNNNALLFTEIKNIEKINKKSSHIRNERKNTNDNNLYKKVKSYQKKIIKDSFDLNKSKFYKASTRIQNFSEKKQNQIIAYRLKKYKIECFIKIFVKIIKNYKRKIFNKFKSINIKAKQFLIILEKIIILNIKRKLISYLYKFIDKNKSKDFPLLLPYKNYPNNYNILNCENNNDTNYQGNAIINDNTLNNSCNIYYDNNNKSNSIRNNLTQNDNFIKSKINTQSSGEKTDSYFYIKKILYPKNTIPFSSKKNKSNRSNRTDYIENKIVNKYKKKLLPKYYKKNNSIGYKKKINNGKNYTSNLNILNKRIKIEQSEITDDSILKNQKSYRSNNFVENEDDILEKAYRYKIFDEDKISNGNIHRNIKSELEDFESKKDDLKTYFFKEIEKLEFPDINNNVQNFMLENGEEMSSF